MYHDIHYYTFDIFDMHYAYRLSSAPGNLNCYTHDSADKFNRSIVSQLEI